MVRCQATGYYPPMNIAVVVGSRNVTADLFLSQTVRMTGSRGMRIVEYVTARWSNSFYAEPEDDGHMLYCHVTDSDSLLNSSREEISVNCELPESSLTYLITCLLRYLFVYLLKCFCTGILIS